MMQNPRCKIYLQFLQLFLEKINELSARDFTSPFYTIHYNRLLRFTFFIFLKPEFKKMDVSEKVQLLTRVKELDIVAIKEGYAKSTSDLTLYFQGVYTGAIDIQAVPLVYCKRYEDFYFEGSL